MRPTLALLGAGLTGATAAATLRQDGFDGDVILIGSEPHPPYERPPLFKQHLRGEMPFETALVRPTGFYEANAIDAWFGDAATHIDPTERTVALASGRSVRYDKLLIARGVRNRRPPIPGLDLPNINPSPTPLFRVLGEPLGRVMSTIHRDHGVETVFEDTVTRFAGDGRVDWVMTRGGRRVDCDLAVVGVGVEPAVGFLAESGVEISNGILVDEYCRTNIEDIYAAGDVANHYPSVSEANARRALAERHATRSRGQKHARRRQAIRSGALFLVRSVRRQPAVRRVPSGVGPGRRARQPRRTECIAFYLNQRRIDAVAFNRGKDVRRVMPLVKAGASVDRRQLADEGADIRSLVAGSPSGIATRRHGG